MSKKTAPKKSKKSNFFSKGLEIRRADTMRIKSYCKQEGITQGELAKRMDVCVGSMSSFMCGKSLVQSGVYTRGMVYLKTRMPGSKIRGDVGIKPNDNWVIDFQPRDAGSA